MKVKRSNVFETNSSSEHVVAVMNESNKYENMKEIQHWDYIKVKKDGIYFEKDDIDIDDTGIVLDTFLEKLLYVICGYIHYMDDIDELDEMLPDLNDILIKYFGFGTDKLHFNKDVSMYINHQSQDMISGFLGSYDIKLEDFLTDSKYKILLDWDDCEFIRDYIEKNKCKIFSECGEYEPWWINY